MKNLVTGAVLILALVFILGGCSAGDQAEVTSAELSSSETEVAELTPVEAENYDYESEPVDLPQEAAAEEHTGDVSEGAYTNEYFALAFDPGDAWSFSSEEELLALAQGNDYDGETLDFEGQLAEYGFSYDVFSYSEDGLKTICVIIESLSALYSADMEAWEYAELSVETAEAELTEAEGFEVLSSEIFTQEFAGTECPAFCVVSEYTDGSYSYEVYQLEVCLKKGDYVLCAVFTSFIDDETSELCSKFYSLGE